MFNSSTVFMCVVLHSELSLMYRLFLRMSEYQYAIHCEARRLVSKLGGGSQRVAAFELSCIFDCK